MKFLNTLPNDHNQIGKIGVLLVNLGTPDAPKRGPVKRYLKQFLSDLRVVEPTVPRWVWWLILNGVILNVRPSRSARAYETVWDYYGEGTGSPLLHISQLQQQKLQAKLGEGLICELAMTYGQPSIESALNKMHRQNVRKLVILPLYPQYSATTTAAVFDQVTSELQRWRFLPEWRFIPHYHDNKDYINALAHSVKKHWQQHGRAERLIISFHGIPLRYLKQGDPYYCFCQKTARLLAERLLLGESQYQVAFQSIFGREPWLQPYTNETLISLAKQGVRSVQVICPGFAADCLETLEEITVENCEIFKTAGGQQFQYINALNAENEHIELFSHLIQNEIQGWCLEKPDQQAFETHSSQYF